MGELFKEDIDKKTDALDTLRKWIIKYAPSYGSIKPEIIIYNKTPVRIIINRGDEKITLEKNTSL